MTFVKIALELLASASADLVPPTVLAHQKRTGKTNPNNRIYVLKRWRYLFDRFLFIRLFGLSLSLRFFPFTLLFVLSSINIVFLFSRKRRRRVKRQTKYNQTNKIRIVLILLVFHSLNSFFSFHCRIACSLSHTVLFVLSVAFSCDFLRRYFYIYIFLFFACARTIFISHY